MSYDSWVSLSAGVNAMARRKSARSNKVARKGGRKVGRKATRKVAKKAKRKGARKVARKAVARPVAAASGAAQPASELISERIAELADWRGEVLRHVRKLMQDADPAIIEEWKWDVPVWSRDGIICTGETYKKAVKLTFARGASLPDPAKLFNSSLEGNTRRAIDIPEGAAIDESAFKDLIRAAVSMNQSGKTG
jgi:hypothetical protein